jgi:WD40-like Beta Propeller Repeat
LLAAGQPGTFCSPHEPLASVGSGPLTYVGPLFLSRLSARGTQAARAGEALHDGPTCRSLVASSAVAAKLRAGILSRFILIVVVLVAPNAMIASGAVPSATTPAPSWEVVAQHIDPSIADVTGLDIVSATRPRPRAVTRRAPRSADWDFDPALSPDGTRVAFRRNYARRPGLYVAAVRRGKPRWLSPPVDARAVWSPDGTRMAFSRGWGEKRGGLYVIRLRDGHTTRVFAAGGFATWSPDGQKLVCSCGRGLGIWVIDAHGRGARRLTANLRIDTGPSWSPDGRLLVYGRNCREQSRDTRACDIAIMNADGANKRIVGGSTQLRVGSPPLWSGPHTLLVPTYLTAGIVSVDLTTGAQATFYSESGALYASSKLTRFAVLSYRSPSRLALLDAGGHVLSRSNARIDAFADQDVFVRG